MEVSSDADVATDAACHLWADHFHHIRCEVGYDAVVAVLRPFLDIELVGLVSLMDHTPGQRQFVSLDKYFEYYQGKFGYSVSEMSDLVQRRRVEQELFADKHRREIAAMCSIRRLPTASHDDATPAHIDEAISFGLTIAEFPTTQEAAR